MSTFLELVDLGRFLGMEGPSLIEIANEQQRLCPADIAAQRHAEKERLEAEERRLFAERQAEKERLEAEEVYIFAEKAKAESETILLETCLAAERAKMEAEKAVQLALLEK